LCLNNTVNNGFNLPKGGLLCLCGAMNETADLLSPLKRLAIAYANRAVRSRWLWLINLDARLWSVVSKGSEPLLIQMRLAWWREQIGQSPTSRAKGEPLLAELSQLEDYAVGIVDYAKQLVDAWDCTAAGDGDAAQAQKFAEMRGTALFGSYARWAGADDAQQQLAAKAGAIWAALDAGIAQETGTLPLKDLRRLKPLSILLLATDGNTNAIRFYWHILTGR
jgi:hypothetical protein